MSNDEQTLLANIAEEPADLARWLVLADWLDEHEDARGQLVRVHVALRVRPPGTGGPNTHQDEARLRELLASGVRPCVPSFTNSVGITLNQVPPGDFRMGSPRDQPGRDEDEVRHEVTISKTVWFGTTPVTQAQYMRLMDDNPSHFAEVDGEDTADFPVDSVQWTEAVDFCHRLTQVPEEREAGRVYRLPTEAEWEYACRAGVSFCQMYHFGPSVSAGQANFNCTDPHPPEQGVAGEPLQRTCRVGSYAPNAWGLFDLHGNVGEWCSDWRGSYRIAERIDPQGPPQGERRVLRGGLWGLGGQYCRCASRDSLGEDGQNSNVGFRVVCVLTGHG